MSWTFTVYMFFLRLSMEELNFYEYLEVNIKTLNDLATLGS